MPRTFVMSAKPTAALSSARGPAAGSRQHIIRSQVCADQSHSGRDRPRDEGYGGYVPQTDLLEGSQKNAPKACEHWPSIAQARAAVKPQTTPHSTLSKQARTSSQPLQTCEHSPGLQTSRQGITFPTGFIPPHKGY